MTVVSRAAHASSVSTKIADNSAGDISAQDIREVFTDLEDSVLWNDEGEVANDTTPQLGGDLDVNGSSIVSTSNANVTITPDGTGNVVLGNYTIDADATVGAGQDNFVLTYDDATGLWGPEAAAGGGGGGGYTQAEIEDFAGGLFTGNTETRITATYQTADNTLDLVVDPDLSLYDNTTSAFLTAATAPVTSVAGKAGAVTIVAGDIASGEFASGRISEASVTQHEAALAIAPSQLSSGLTASQISDEAVTVDKMQHIATDSFLGRDTAGAGDVEILSVGTVRTLLNVADGAEVNTIDSDPTGVTGADQITNIISLTQAEYDAIGSPDAATFYVITG